jgi:rubrerythrin
MPVDEKVLEPLRQGMINEIRGDKFYHEVAARTANAKAQAMFLSLAKDEQGHLHILQQQYAAITHGEDWMPVGAATAAGAPAPKLNLFPDGAAKGLLKPKATDEEALEMALAMEKRGYDLYKTAHDDVDDLTAKAMFEFLMKEESRHYQVLDQTLNYLKKKGFWYFQDEEKPMFDQ